MKTIKQLLQEREKHVNLFMKGYWRAVNAGKMKNTEYYAMQMRKKFTDLDVEDVYYNTMDWKQADAEVEKLDSHNKAQGKYPSVEDLHKMAKVEAQRRKIKLGTSRRPGLSKELDAQHKAVGNKTTGWWN